MAPPRSVWAGSQLLTRRLAIGVTLGRRLAAPADRIPSRLSSAPSAPLRCPFCSANAPEDRTTGIEKGAIAVRTRAQAPPSQPIAALRSDILRRRALPTQIVEEPAHG